MAQTSCNNSLWQKVLSPAKPKELQTYDTFRINRADRKYQVRQYLGFCTADFWSLLAYESAEQKPKHHLT